MIEKSSIIDVESNEKEKRKICAKRLCHTIICIHEKILDICIGAIFIFYLDKKKKNRIERLNDKKKNLKLCTVKEKFARTKICYVIIYYPEKYLFN